MKRGGSHDITFDGVPFIILQFNAGRLAQLVRASYLFTLLDLWTVSSAVERFVYTEEAAGSSPAPSMKNLTWQAAKVQGSNP